jgi:hypothetical protein
MSTRPSCGALASGTRLSSGPPGSSRYWERVLQGSVAQPDAVALKAELAAAKARIAELHRALAEAERKLIKPKVEKPPLPPDEQRERTIKGLRTRVRNLTDQLQAVAGRGSMSFKTMSAIAKALDSDRQLTAKEREAERAEAFVDGVCEFVDDAWCQERREIGGSSLATIHPRNLRN